MKTSQLQSLLAIHANLICAIHSECRDMRHVVNESGMVFSKGERQAIYKEIRGLRSLVKRLARHQRAIKDDIKAARTTKSVYKKHAKIEAIENTPNDAAWLADYVKVSHAA